jgi:hypothetical protein
MTRAHVLAGLVAALALAACNDSDLPPGGTYQAVQGVVIDSATHQPIAGAVVTVDTVLSATTDANGKFSFAKVPVGEIDYEVSLPDNRYQTYSSTAHLAPDKPLQLTVALSH